MNSNRRSFLRAASMVTAGSVLGMRPFGLMNAMAQTADDYKALVCIFLTGGNDANNMIVPFDSAGYGAYAALRGPLALGQSSLLQLGSMPGYALHPSMPELRSLIDSGAGAVVANTGTLISPIGRAQYLAGQAAPLSLFSHSDQQQQWQSAASAGTGTGWGGRIADQISGSYNPGAQIPMITSMAGDTLFCDGSNMMPMALVPGQSNVSACTEGGACSTRWAAEQALLTFNSGLALVQADNAITSNAVGYASTLAGATQSIATFKTPYPANNPLARQLNQVAQIIAARSALGVRRQIFFCGLGDFDTHGGQLGAHAALLQQLSQGISSFYQTMVELGISNSVTAFTMSEFGRAFQPNSANGSDHAWGSHHVIVGGAVKGAQMYGSYPTLALGGPDDSGTNGRWIPTTSTVQYAATLSKWFGLNSAQLSTIFPMLGSFTKADIGFIRS